MQDFNLAKDQRLHGKSNFNEWKFLIDNAAKRQGIKEFMEVDVVGKLNDVGFDYNPNVNDVINKVITKLITKMLPQAPAEPIRNNNAEVNRNNNVDINTQLTNFFGNPLNHIRLVEEAERIDADMILMISKNVDDSVLREISRLNNGFRIMERLKSKYGNSNADMEYWLKRLRSIKARDRNQIIEKLELMKETFDDMEEQHVEITDKEKLKYLYNVLPDDYKNIIQINLNSDPNVYINNLKSFIYAKSYLENWEDNKTIEKDDPMDLDFISRGRRTSNSSKKNEHNNHNNKSSNSKKRGKQNGNQYNNNNKDNSNKDNNNKSYCHICEVKGHSTRNCIYNMKTKSNHNKGRQEKLQVKTTLNDHPKKSLHLISKISDPDSASSYDDNFDFEDARALIEKQEEININNKVKFSGLIEYVNDSSIIPKEITIPNKKEELYVNNINYYEENDKTSEWLYDTGAGEHITNDFNLLNNFIHCKIKLRCANGTMCSFEGYGTYECYINGIYLRLDKVLYSKSATKNLISGIELAKIGYRVIIDTDDYTRGRFNLWGPNNVYIGTYYSTNDNQFLVNTYKINKNFEEKDKNIMALNEVDEKSLEIWHRRLGHYYLENINKYLSLHQIKTPKCIECKVAKMSRKSHGGKTPKATKILEIIHSDISGPYNSSINNKKYFITFMDEFSRKVWIYTLKSKAEAPELIVEFFKYLNNQFEEYNIKIFKSDGGKEFKNKTVNKYCKENGIEKPILPQVVLRRKS